MWKGASVYISALSGYWKYEAYSQLHLPTLYFFLLRANLYKHVTPWPWFYSGLLPFKPVFFFKEPLPFGSTHGLWSWEKGAHQVLKRLFDFKEPRLAFNTLFCAGVQILYCFCIALFHCIRWKGQEFMFIPIPFSKYTERRGSHLKWSFIHPCGLCICLGTDVSCTWVLVLAENIMWDAPSSQDQHL